MPARGPGPWDLQLKSPSEIWQHFESKWTMFQISVIMAARWLVPVVVVIPKPYCPIRLGKPVGLLRQLTGTGMLSRMQFAFASAFAQRQMLVERRKSEWMWCSSTENRHFIGHLGSVYVVFSLFCFGFLLCCFLCYLLSLGCGALPGITVKTLISLKRAQ